MRRASVRREIGGVVDRGCLRGEVSGADSAGRVGRSVNTSLENARGGRKGSICCGKK